MRATPRLCRAVKLLSTWLRRGSRRYARADRNLAARELGFTAPTANSIDATSDRDFILEYLQALTFVGLHLSRFAEEITLFATAEFSFITLPEAFSTAPAPCPEEEPRPH